MSIQTDKIYYSNVIPNTAGILLPVSQDCFRKIEQFILYIYYVIQITLCSTTQNIYEGDLLLKTQNTVKMEECETFTSLSHTPQLVPLEIKKDLYNRGFLSDDFDVEIDQIPLSPTSAVGKCNGGTCLFLNRVLNDTPEETILDEFKGGIPLDDVLYQELYQQINLYIDPDIEYAYQFIMDRFDRQTIEQMITQFEKSPRKNISSYIPSESPPQNPRPYYILEACLYYCRDSKMRDFKQEPIDYINQRLLELYDEKELLSAAERGAVSEIIDNEKFQIHPNERFALNLQGLDIERSITGYDRTATKILSKVESLDSGAYKLTMPCYNLFGKQCNYHTIAFVVQRDRTTFYDANYAITHQTPCPEQANSIGKQRKNTIRTVLRKYTGHTFKRNLNLFEKAAHIFGNIIAGHQNPFAWGAPTSGFLLYKVKTL